jgi:excinuclease UvrABC nuclease subunit
LEKVAVAIQFLEGDDSALLNAIHEQLIAAAEQNDFERARTLRNAIQTLGAIATASRRLAHDRQSRQVVLILPSHDEVNVRVALVYGSRIWSVCSMSRREPSEQVAGRLMRSYERMSSIGLRPIDQITLDDALILSRWLERNDGHPAIINLLAEVRPDWHGIATQAAELSYAEFEAWRPLDDREVVDDELTYVNSIDSDPVDPGGPALLAPLATNDAASISV